VGLDRENFGFSTTVITWLFAPKPTKRGKCVPSLGSLPAFSTSAIARWLCFSSRSYCRENLPLRGTFISVFEPKVSKHSFSKLSESGQGLFSSQPCLAIYDFKTKETLGIFNGEMARSKSS